ncbi:hypothetical protein SESBI_19406 [Sesbania bispinosa]|nr:hypothetical protein SESBI_19406 [Sesbania bispinosa]
MLDGAARRGDGGWMRMLVDALTTAGCGCWLMRSDLPFILSTVTAMGRVVPSRIGGWRLPHAVVSPLHISILSHSPCLLSSFKNQDVHFTIYFPLMIVAKTVGGFFFK